MKKIKKFDFVINFILFISLLIWYLLNPGFENAIMAYFIMGGWQVISMIIHEVNKWFISRTGTRRMYHWISLLSLILLPFGFFWVLAFAAPFMAAFYIYLCYREVFIKMQRPLALLK